MPRTLPQGRQFYIERKAKPANYEMPSLEAASDHYSMGYEVCGDRIVITPNMTYTLHPGCVGTIPPFLYHRNGPASDDIYDRFLLKFSLDFVKPFTDEFGQQTLDRIFDYPVHHFLRDMQRKVFTLFEDMLKVYQSNSIYSDFTLQCMLFELFFLILEKSLPNDDKAFHPTPLTPPIIEAIFYIENHYYEPLSLETVAKIAGFSPAYFSRLFQKQLGKTYSEYLINVRLTHAKSLLLGTDKSITEIALETGYTYAANLTEQFKKKIGMTPLSYRKTHNYL